MKIRVWRELYRELRDAVRPRVTELLKSGHLEQYGNKSEKAHPEARENRVMTVRVRVGVREVYQPGLFPISEVIPVVTQWWNEKKRMESAAQGCEI